MSRLHKQIVRREISFTPDQWPNNVPSILRRVYSRRALSSTKEFEKHLHDLIPYSSLKNIDAACDLLFRHLEKQNSIVIIGDFDADGATSTAVAVKALRFFGAQCVNYRVPNRFRYGYGLTPEIVEWVTDLKPNLIVTVDNGISSIDGVLTAKQKNIDVLVTDHHLPGNELPVADVIVNPNQAGDEFAAKSTAGVGVIFYVMLALRAYLREKNWFQEQGLAEPNMATLLDLVALGTVADVVPLEHNNRILVEQGLKRIRANQCCSGIVALAEVSQRTIESIRATDLGYAFGPRLNAAGRLEDMSIGIQCLLAENLSTARRYAAQLQQLNVERRAIESEMQTQAFALLRNLPISTATELPTGLCLYDSLWHIGVIGILASRVKDRFHRPVIIFANNENAEDELKGSARSIDGVHIRDVLDAIATQNPGLIQKFGGHAMAAGLSICKKDFELFCDLFDQEVKRHVNTNDIKGIVLSDGELEPSELNIDTARILRNAEPWGQHFSEPVFDGMFYLKNVRVLADKHLKLSLQPLQEKRVIDAIAFNWLNDENKKAEFASNQPLRIAYKLDINHYQSFTNLQLIVEHIEV